MVTLVERHSRFTMLVKLPRKDTTTVVAGPWVGRARLSVPGRRAQVGHIARDWPPVLDEAPGGCIGLTFLCIGVVAAPLKGGKGFSSKLEERPMTPAILFTAAAAALLV